MAGKTEATERDARPERRVTDLLIRIGLLGMFTYWSLTLVRPFWLIGIWAVILCVSLHPVYARLRAWFGGRGWPGAVLLVFCGLAIIFGPVAALALGLAEDAGRLMRELEQGSLTLPPPPEMLRSLPVIGDGLFSAWSSMLSNLPEVLKLHRAELLHYGGAFAAKVAGFGGGLLILAASVVLAGVLLGHAPELVGWSRTLGRRIDAERGEHFVDLAGATIRNVSRGVIGVAVLQALLAGLVLGLFHVPWAAMIALLILALCVVQVGPALVLVPLIIWAWLAMPWGSALLFTLLLAPMLLIDNVLKPILMARGLSTPVAIILVGVIGGTISHGLIGLFIGPIVLSVFHELVVAWIRETPAPMA